MSHPKVELWWQLKPSCGCHVVTENEDDLIYDRWAQKMVSLPHIWIQCYFFFCILRSSSMSKQARNTLPVKVSSEPIILVSSGSLWGCEFIIMDFSPTKKMRGLLSPKFWALVRLEYERLLSIRTLLLQAKIAFCHKLESCHKDCETHSLSSHERKNAIRHCDFIKILAIFHLQKIINELRHKFFKFHSVQYSLHSVLTFLCMF